MTTIGPPKIPRVAMTNRVASGLILVMVPAALVTVLLSALQPAPVELAQYRMDGVLHTDDDTNADSYKIDGDLVTGGQKQSFSVPLTIPLPCGGGGCGGAGGNAAAMGPKAKRAFRAAKLVTRRDKRSLKRLRATTRRSKTLVAGLKTTVRNLLRSLSRSAHSRFKVPTRAIFSDLPQVMKKSLKNRLKDFRRKAHRRPGLTGRRGKTGSRGFRGLRGLRGARGPTGRRGIAGRRGRRGRIGGKGKRGLTGPRGRRGPRGPPGPRGSRGGNGRKGPRGRRGRRGPRGFPGRK